MRLVRLGPLLPLVLLCAGSLAWGLPVLQWDFETPDADWGRCSLDKGTQNVALSTTRASSGKASLAISGSLPQGFGTTYLPWDDWTGYQQLSFDLYVPKNVPKEFDVWVYLKDHQYYWYQTAPFRSPTSGKLLPTFKPGTWMKVKLDLSPTATIWKPGGHRKAWERTLYYPREFGLRFFSRKSWTGTVNLDNVKLSGGALPLGRYQPGTPRLLSTRLKLTASAATVPQYRKFELSFGLDRNYDNPYDPGVVDVWGHFTGPDGTKIEQPGFLYQSFDRQKTREGYEQLIPVGHTCWKVRFAPPRQGKYTYYVSVRDALGETRSPVQSFTATAPTDPRGYVRVSQKDPRCFEFANGDYFRPVGINMRDGGDQAEAQRGSFDFEEYFKAFHEAGLNFVRTWMCAWWGGIEWSDKYHSRFDGVGRYSQYNAWRLDQAFDLAEKNDLFVELTLNSHGQFRRDKFDAEWMYNPYNVRNGGFLASPPMFFTSNRARELVKQRYRYIVARWGYSQNLMSWDMVNEVDLTEGYRGDIVAAWHKELAAYLKSLDPYKHLVVTHICLHGNGNELWQLPEIDYIQADAYWKRRDVGMAECWAGKQAYEKPFMFIEYGPQTVTVREAGEAFTFERWQQDFRVGLWVSNLIPSAAPGQFWYHDAWKQHGLGRYQQGLLAFEKGEDRRGQNYRTIRGFITAPGIPDWRPTREERERGAGPPLAIQAMTNGKRARFYAYHFANMLEPEPTKLAPDKWVKGATISLYGFEDGNYQVELWDPVTGKVLSTLPATAQQGRLSFTAPDFPEDLAGKINPA